MIEQPYWAVVPAAGVGSRMRADRPKQYLSIGGRTVLEHTLTALADCPRIRALVVVISPEDPYWSGLSLNLDKPLLVTSGGQERADSVLNGLEALPPEATAEDWVLVHDAARPCLRQEDLQRLFAPPHDEGAILAVPAKDTKKLAGADGRIEQTLDRSRMWQALTPQMFRLGPLKKALRSARKRSLAVTDEASAMEFAGYRPDLVEGHADNIKITRPEDLALAEFYLHQQGRL